MTEPDTAAPLTAVERNAQKAVREQGLCGAVGKGRVCIRDPHDGLHGFEVDDTGGGVALPLELADDFGGRVQVMHGSVCVGVVIHDKPGLVLTPEQARTLAAMLTRQAEQAEATYA